MMMVEKMKSYVEEQPRRTPVVGEADVVVIGGGPGGVPAAIAAARRGASVMVIEHYGFLGGLASAGMIGPLFGYNTAQANELMLGGIPLEIIHELQSLGGAPQEKNISWIGVPFEPEMMKHALERLAVRTGKIQFLLHTHAVGVIRKDSMIDSVIVENKSGRGAVKGRVFIDATGDGDVAALAGCEFTKGRAIDGATQSMGTKFRIGGVQSMSEEQRKQSTEIFRKAIDEKAVPVYHPFAGEVSEYGTSLRMNEATPTVTRARGDGTNAEDLTRNEIQLRADTLEIVEFCRKNIPGFENAYLMATPPQIGVRETRQITGQYVLTGNECLDKVRFDDGIVRGSWFMDIHCPMGFKGSRSWCCDKNCKMPTSCKVRNEHFETLYDNLYLENGTYYEIPYRSLTPKGMDNLLISGRCISADHGAMASLRVIGTCFAIGQAAGTAASMALQQETQPGKLDGRTVRETLVKDGVPL